MRKIIIIPVISFVGLVFLLVGWLRPAPGPLTALPKVTPLVSNPISMPAAESSTFRPAAPQRLSATQPVGDDTASQENPGVVDRVAELQTLAMNNDADSLGQIIVSLSDPDPGIRAAALAATIQFRSPTAIPALQDQLARTAAPQEKLDLQQAIDFLALPPLAQANSNNPSADN